MAVFYRNTWTESSSHTTASTLLLICLVNKPLDSKTIKSYTTQKFLQECGLDLLGTFMDMVGPAPFAFPIHCRGEGAFKKLANNWLCMYETCYRDSKKQKLSVQVE